MSPSRPASQVIARELKERALVDSKTRTPAGAPWSAVTVKRVRDRLAAGV